MDKCYLCMGAGIVMIGQGELLECNIDIQKTVLYDFPYRCKCQRGQKYENIMPLITAIPFWADIEAKNKDLVNKEQSKTA